MKCRQDSPGQGLLLPAEKCAPNDAVIDLGGTGSLPGANTGTIAGGLRIYHNFCCCIVWRTHAISNFNFLQHQT